jgi:hypothetical protein
MNIKLLIVLGVITFSGLNTLNAYDWTVHNATSSPIDTKVRLLGCLAHDPKQTIAAGDQYKFHVGGWSFGCCLKTDGLEVNGKKIKHIDYETILKRHPMLAGVVDAIIGVGSVVGGGSAVISGIGAIGATAVVPEAALFLLTGLLAAGVTGLAVFLEDEIKSTCGDSDFVISEDGKGGFIAIQKPKSKK